MQGSGGRGPGSGVRVQGSGCMVQGSGVRGQGSGVRGQGSGRPWCTCCPRYSPSVRWGEGGGTALEVGFVGFVRGGTSAARGKKVGDIVPGQTQGAAGVEVQM